MLLSVQDVAAFHFGESSIRHIDDPAIKLPPDVCLGSFFLGLSVIYSYEPFSLFHHSGFSYDDIWADTEV